jgi:hypothetical protein
MTPHDQITASTDRVLCPIGQGDLSAAVCGQRHLAREWRGNRYLRIVGDLARYPSCAACPLGAVAVERLAMPGRPGAGPRTANAGIMREVGEQPRKRPPRGERMVLEEPPPEAHPRVVRHPADALARGVLPWAR